MLSVEFNFTASSEAAIANCGQWTKSGKDL